MLEELGCYPFCSAKTGLSYSERPTAISAMGEDPGE